MTASSCFGFVIALTFFGEKKKQVAHEHWKAHVVLLWVCFERWAVGSVVLLRKSRKLYFCK